MAWYIYLKNEKKGPLSARDIREMVRTGFASVNDYVSKDNSPLRRKLMDMSEILDARISKDHDPILQTFQMAQASGDEEITKQIDITEENKVVTESHFPVAAIEVADPKKRQAIGSNKHFDSNIVYPRVVSKVPPSQEARVVPVQASPIERIPSPKAPRRLNSTSVSAMHSQYKENPKRNKFVYRAQPSYFIPILVSFVIGAAFVVMIAMYFSKKQKKINRRTFNVSQESSKYPASWPLPAVSYSHEMRKNILKTITLTGITRYKLPKNCMPCRITAELGDNTKVVLVSQTLLPWTGIGARKVVAVKGLLQKEENGEFWVIVQDVVEK